MKKLLILLLAVLLLSGCAAPARQMQQLTYLDVFDTVMTVRSFDSADRFQKNAAAVHDALLQYHKLFDIYNDYDGINNLKTVNDQAGISPVPVDGRIIALLLDCKQYYSLTGGRMNPAMGSVLRLWHEKREAGFADPANASLPDEAALLEASKHCNFDDVIIDEAASTVYIRDPELRLDVGAAAKGWSAQQASSLLPEGYLLDLGCNICITGPKPEGAAWNIGIQSPDNGQEYLCAVAVSEGSVVTSGDYHRYYEVDGTRYHHIIDPDTLQPADFWRSVSIICGDSGLADCLSTALFTMDYNAGAAILQKVGGEAMWVAKDGSIYATSGFQNYIKS